MTRGMYYSKQLHIYYHTSRKFVSGAYYRETNIIKTLFVPVPDFGEESVPWCFSITILWYGSGCFLHLVISRSFLECDAN